MSYLYSASLSVLMVALAAAGGEQISPDDTWTATSTGESVQVLGTISNSGGERSTRVDRKSDDLVEQGDIARREFEGCFLNFEERYSCPALTKPGDPVPADPGTPAISITDVVEFAPVGTVAKLEPNNLGVAGLPINAVAAVSAQTASGTLFGIPVTVRFTPVSYVFDFGDGTVITTNTGGSTWEQLGQAQFTPTPTSHTYNERGTYNAHVDAHYSAEVDLGSGWIPLTGTVTSQGPAQQIRIFEAHTALVAHTCTEAPTSPGC